MDAGQSRVWLTLVTERKSAMKAFRWRTESDLPPTKPSALLHSPSARRKWDSRLPAAETGGRRQSEGGGGLLILPRIFTQNPLCEFE